VSGDSLRLDHNTRCNLNIPLSRLFALRRGHGRLDTYCVTPWLWSSRKGIVGE
jgi:hypothetical protein